MDKLLPHTMHIPCIVWHGIFLMCVHSTRYESSWMRSWQRNAELFPSLSVCIIHEYFDCVQFYMDAYNDSVVRWVARVEKNTSRFWIVLKPSTDHQSSVGTLLWLWTIHGSCICCASHRIHKFITIESHYINIKKKSLFSINARSQ